MPDVADDADDFTRLRLRTASKQVLAYRVLIREEAARKTLIYDHGSRRVCDVMFAKNPAPQQWDTHRPKIIGTHNSHRDDRPLGERGHRPAMDRDKSTRIGSGQRQSLRRTGGGNTWKQRQFLTKPGVERRALSGLAVP